MRDKHEAGEEHKVGREQLVQSPLAHRGEQVRDERLDHFGVEEFEVRSGTEFSHQVHRFVLVEIVQVWDINHLELNVGFLDFKLRCLLLIVVS